MKKRFFIEIDFDLTEELQKEYVGDEQVREGLREMLEEELPEECKPKIIIWGGDADNSFASAKGFSLMDLNGVLSNTLISIEEKRNIWNGDTLNLFQEIACEFSDRIYKLIEEE